MGVLCLTDAKLWVQEFDFTSQFNKLGIDYGAAMNDATVFGKDSIINKGGLKEVGFAHEGLWDSTQDLTLFNNVGVADVPMTIAPDNAGVDGERCFLLKAIQAEYTPGAAVGELFAFNYSGMADELIRATIMANLTLAATANGTARQLGTVGSGLAVFSTLHVIAASGSSPTLDVTIESDDGAGFASPTVQITHPQFGAVGSSILSTSFANGLTDDYWRAVLTVGGGSPSFTVVIGIGIKV